VCRREIEHAVKNNKRLVPLVVRDVSGDEAPTELSHLNWIFFRETDDFDHSLLKLTTAVQTDYEWVQTHRELQSKALEWERSKYDKSFLLQGTELQAAEFQLTSNASKEPHPTNLQLDYVLKSGQAAESQKRIRNSIAIVVGVVITLLAIFGWLQAGIATKNEQAAQAESTKAFNSEGTAVAESTRANNNALTAVANEKIARAGELAAMAVTQREKQFDASLLLAVEALKASGTKRLRNVLDAAMENAQTNPQLSQYLPGHNDRVSSLALSPDGKILAAGGNDGSIILWDMESRQRIGKPLTKHRKSVDSLAFSPDGRILASGSCEKSSEDKIVCFGGEILLWDVESHQFLGEPLYGHTGAVDSLTFSSDGKTLVSGSYGDTVLLWDMESRPTTGTPLLGANLYVTSRSISPDGKTLALGMLDGSMLLWDMENHQLSDPLSGHEGTVSGVAFSPDGKTFVSMDVNGTILVWDLESRQHSEPYTADGAPVSGISLSPDGKTLAFRSYDGAIVLWDMEWHQPIGKPLIEPGMRATELDIGRSNGNVVFSPDGGTLAAGSYRGPVVLWDVSFLQDRNRSRPESLNHASLNQALKGYAGTAYGTVFSVAFSPDGKTLASGGAEGTVLLWSIKNRPLIANLLPGSDSGVRSVAFSPDGSTLVSGREDGAVVFWNVKSRQSGEPLIAHDGVVFSVAFSPDGKTVASASEDDTVVLWDVESRLPSEPFKGHTGNVFSVAFSPDDKTLASGSQDGTIILWDVASHQQRDPLTVSDQFVMSVTFSPDGKTLAAGLYDGSVILWDVKSRQHSEPFQGHDQPVTSVAFSPDGKILAAGSYDRSIILWDVESHQTIGKRLSAEAFSNIESLAFSPDGKTLASGSWDGTLLLWDLDPKSWAEQSCQRAGRNFTRSEWLQYFPGKPYPAKPEDATCPQWPLEPGNITTQTAPP
jgi:WD40 repeat protein